MSGNKRVNAKKQVTQVNEIENKGLYYNTSKVYNAFDNLLLIENTEHDSKWTVVEWVSTTNKIEYSTVQFQDFIDPNICFNDLKINEIYKIKFHGLKYKAKLCFIGNYCYTF